MNIAYQLVYLFIILIVTGFIIYRIYNAKGLEKRGRNEDKPKMPYCGGGIN